MAEMKVAEAFVQMIVKEGIKAAFGIPGAAINPVYQYLENVDIEHLTMRHEEACVHAADGYQRAKHETAMAICSAGPGATNFVTGLYTAFIDSMPVFCVVGQANTNQLDQEPFQCVDMVDIAKTVSKGVFRPMKPEDLPGMVQEAFYLMREGRPGPVVIDFPTNVQNMKMDFDIDSYEPKYYTKPAADAAKIAEAVKMMKDAKAPVIIMGGGCVISECEDKVIKLAEQLNVPVITTYAAKGGIPDSHPLSAGHAGIQCGQPAGNEIFLDSDFVLGIGCRYADRHTGGLQVYKTARHERKFVNINISEKQSNLVFDPDLAIIADAGLAVDALIEATKGMSFAARDIAGYHAKFDRKTDFDSSPIMPHRFFQELNEGFCDNTYFTAGCGITQIWSGQLQKIEKTRKYLPSAGAGTLGYEVPAALGAKVAMPDCDSVVVVGDFGLTFLGEEIAVATAYNKPIIICVLNNAYLGLIRENQLGYGFEYAVAMPYNQDGRVDYVHLAEAYGCKAERVSTPAELAIAIQNAKEISRKTLRPYLIDAICIKTQLCDMGGNIDNIPVKPVIKETSYTSLG